LATPGGCPQEVAAHVARVLRARAGQLLTLFDGRGGEYDATILQIDRRGVQVRIELHRAIERESPLPVTLLQALARGERMDFIVQKATELGVAAIVAMGGAQCGAAGWRRPGAALRALARGGDQRLRAVRAQSRADDQRRARPGERLRAGRCRESAAAARPRSRPAADGSMARQASSDQLWRSAPKAASATKNARSRNSRASSCARLGPGCCAPRPRRWRRWRRCRRSRVIF
jgi:hypothetical protein